MQSPSGQAGPAPDAETVGFEQMRLQIGEVLRISPQEAGTPQVHYAVQYIGGLSGKGFITTLPVSGDKLLWMPPGSLYVMRVLCGTHAYAFTSQVIRARATPYPHVHFRYPATVQARKVRKSLRVGMHLAVELVAGGNTLAATLLDLSMHGARIEADTPVEGDTVELVLPIRLDEADSRLRLAARVRNRQGAEGNAPSRRLGLEFDKLAEQDALLLHYFIDHAVAEAGARKR